MFVPVEQLAGKSIGQYKLTKLIGRSELSAVYEAVSSSQTSAVMLTVFRLPDECVGEAWELFMERFEEETSRLRGLQHPHVVPYYEFGEEFGYPYLITPLTSNKTLVDLLQQDVCVPAQMLELLTQIASGLDYIHSRGIVHGSLKPSNILLRDEPGGQRVLIANAGITQIVEMRGIGQVAHSHPHLFSVAGTLLTNPAYLAPEVVQGAPGDARSDIYALGMLVYEMLCGRPPFVGSDPIEVALQHVQQRIPPLSSIRSELPDALDLVLQTALEHDPGRRIQRAEKLARAFKRTIAMLQEAGKVTPLPQHVPMSTRKGDPVELPWQGMPGVTVSKMPSLAPEFLVGPARATQRPTGTGSQFKLLGSSAAHPPLASSPAAPAVPAQNRATGGLFKPPMLPNTGMGTSSPLNAPAASGLPVRQPGPPAQLAQPQSVQHQVQPVASSSPLVTVIATDKQAQQMLPDMQAAASAAQSTAQAAPMAAGGYGAQMPVGGQYVAMQGAPVFQASPAQAPGTNANYAGVPQPVQPVQPVGWVPNAYSGMDMAAPASVGMQAGGMYNNPAYTQQQQYMNGYEQGPWGQYEQPLPPAPNKGRRRAVAIVTGAVVAAVLGAGGINLMRTKQDGNTANTQPTPLNTDNTSNQAQASMPTKGPQNTSNAAPAPAQGNKKTSTVIAQQKNLAKNAAQDFTNPIDKHPAILIHLPNGDFVAYDKACTHQGVAVTYDPKTSKLVCPLHNSIFDPADNGLVVKGPAFLSLPKVKIQVNADGSLSVVG